MKTESLRSVTLATIENYRAAANQAARAYRLGGRRLLAAVNAGLEKNVDARAAMLVPQVADAMVEMRGRVSDAMVKRIDDVTSRTEQAVDLGTDGVIKQLTKVADFADGIANPLLANGLQTAARISLPVAKVGLTVSSKVADGAKALSGAAQGAGVAQRAARSVKRAGATAQRKVAATTKTSRKAAPFADMLSDVAAKVGKTTTRTTTRATRQAKAQAADVVAQAEATVKQATKAVRQAAAAPKKTAVRAKRKVAG
jgi:hypothetical protein